ncbi:MAG TPA: putative sulfate exporter family transporter [Kofleriaceae bacterium]|nr:putative sulfate exporter family transporter [Kofleriaceae bacterium]
MVSRNRPSALPGLAITLAIAVLAQLLHQLPVPPFSIGDPPRHPIDAMLIAIVIGIVVRNTVGLPTVFAHGIRWSVISLLPIAIVLMGAKLDFFDVMRTSGHALIISVVCVAVALGLTIWLCRRTGVGQKLGILIGVGTAICGGTAIAVTAPIIEADDTETAFAITAITLFGLLSVFLFPVLGALFDMSQREFGVWAGTSIHATPQVVATGFAYGQEAGDIATIVKLVRVLLLAPVVILIGAWYAAQKRRRQQAHVTQIGRLSTLFPPFIFGFVLIALANTLHLLPNFTLHLEESFLWQQQELSVTLAHVVTAVSGFLITMSMAGVGLGVHLRGLATVGFKALYVGLFATVVLACFSYALLSIAL